MVQKWLDEAIAGCVYFTFGSMIRVETFPKNIIDALMKSFQDIAPVRVLMKVADLKVFPSKIPENVLTQPWLNQIQVLSKLLVFKYINLSNINMYLKSCL